MDLPRVPRRRRWPWIAGSLALLLVVLVLVTSRSTRAEATADRGSAWTDRVRRGDLVIEVPVHGTLAPERLRWLSAESAARVAKIAVKPGAIVEPDTVVVVLENTDLALGALEAGRAVASAEAKLADLDVRWGAEESQERATVVDLRGQLRDGARHAENANRLAKEGLVAENERQDLVARPVTLAERLESEEARLRLLTAGRERQLTAQRLEIDLMREAAALRRRQVTALEVRAGAHGVVQEIALETGQWVSAGAVLARIAEPGALKADLTVAEAWGRDLARGQVVRFPGIGARGTVTRIAPAVVGGSIRVEATVEGRLAGARPDQAVTGTIEIAKLGGVLQVGRPAGARDQAPARVYRIEPDGAHAVARDVVFGRGSARAVAVESGLEEGDEIVVSDVSPWDGKSRVRWR